MLFPYSIFRNSEQSKCLWRLTDISEKSENDGKESFFEFINVLHQSLCKILQQALELDQSLVSEPTRLCLILGAGSLRAKFELSNGPSHPSTLAVQFMNEGSTLSGVDMELQGAGYRLSLSKKRFATGV